MLDYDLNSLSGVTYLIIHLWFLDQTQAMWVQLMNKRQCVSVLYYVNIRFIANVQLYPNTIVNNCFQDTLQQQYLYLYKTHRNFSTSFSLWSLTHGPGLLAVVVKEKKKKSLVAWKTTTTTAEFSVEICSSYYGQALLSCHRFQVGIWARNGPDTGRRC